MLVPTETDPLSILPAAEPLRRQLRSQRLCEPVWHLLQRDHVQIADELHSGNRTLFRRHVVPGIQMGDSGVLELWGTHRLAIHWK